MARTLLTIGGHGTAVKGLDGVLDRLNKIPGVVKVQIAAAVDGAADQLVGDIKAIAPASDLEARAGDLRDSVHKTPGRHELSRLVVVDAKDAHGHGFAPHVEFGHKTKGGGHAAPEPFFYPSVRRAKPKLRAKVGRAASKALKDIYG